MAASLGSILSIATSALRASQAAVSVTAHNIANAETEGFSRQRAVLTEGFPVYFPQGAYGTGVRVNDVVRIRDELSNNAVRRESSLQREFSSRGELLGRLEALLGEPGEGGVAAGLDRFFSAWSELASNPSSPFLRVTLREEASTLVDRFRGLAVGVSELQAEGRGRLQGSVDRINTLSETLGGLNREIVAAESGVGMANDLRDARDRLLDELSGLLPITVTQRENGSVGVLTGGISLVDGASWGTMEVRSSGGVISLGVVGRPGSLTEVGGSTGGVLRLLNEDLPGAREALDRVAGALVEEVNALHRTGVNGAGDTGVDFFDSAGITATSIRLSVAVTASAAAISAGTGDALGAPRPGANDVALLLAGLRDRPLGATGRTAGEGIRALVSEVGNAVRSSRDGEEVHRVLADRARWQRESVSGVSTDEEMARLIRFQAAYAAAARLVTTADEMMEAILRM